MWKQFPRAMICNCSQFPEKTRSFSAHTAIKNKPTIIRKWVVWDFFGDRIKSITNHCYQYSKTLNVLCDKYLLYIVCLWDLKLHFFYLPDAITHHVLKHTNKGTKPIYPVLSTLLLTNKNKMPVQPLSFPSPASSIL